MFKKNTSHQQPDLFGFFNQLPAQMQRKLIESEEYAFYRLIFSHIQEEDFACLYSENGSRPNAPINAMVSSLFLKERRGWTFEELFDQIQFNLLTKAALGLSRLDEMPFCQASLFNFMNRLNEHFIQSGENLLEKVFDHLTARQLKDLKIKTTIQRTDSFLAASHIRNYTRMQLLIELVLRIWRVLSEEDKARFKERFSSYLGKSSGQYIYRLSAEDLPHEFDKLAQLYDWIDQNLKPLYADREIFHTFERVFNEHFTRTVERIQLRKSEELSSGCVQSPDDLDATYRKKNDKQSRGQSINLVETTHPENPIDLIHDVSVHPNNIDDSKILEGRLDRLTEKTPDLEELHFDGGYGSENVDKKLDELEIIGIQTAVRGNRCKVDIRIELQSNSQYQVSCPYQSVSSVPARKRHKACFDLTICAICPVRKQCPAKTGSRYQTYYFSHQDFLSKRRQEAIHHIPEERQRLRANIEASVREFTHRMPQGKLKVRGFFKTSVFAFSTAVAINFSRIYRYLKKNPEIALSLALKPYVYVKDQIRRLFSLVQDHLKQSLLRRLKLSVSWYSIKILTLIWHFLEQTHF